MLRTDTRTELNKICGGKTNCYSPSEMPEPDVSFINYGNGAKGPTLVFVGDGRSRVRRVMRTTTRQVTVISYNSAKKESKTHTSHHITTVR